MAEIDVLDLLIHLKFREIVRETGFFYLLFRFLWCPCPFPRTNSLAPSVSTQLNSVLKPKPIIIRKTLETHQPFVCSGGLIYLILVRYYLI